MFLLEEFSAKAFLETFLFRAFPSLSRCTVQFVVFEGKRDLDTKLERRLKHWQLPNSYFIVVRDRDSDDCVQLKQRLLEKVQRAGRLPNTVVRIACAELESWFLGELIAVEEALDVRNLSRRQSRAKYRNPDALMSPSSELIKVSRERYQKVSGSRALGGRLSSSASKNTSHSFGVFLAGISRLISGIPELQESSS